MSLISQQAQQSVADSTRKFAEQDPFRHVVIDNFLESGFCQRLLEDFPRFEDRFALNEMGKVGGKAVRTAVRDISAAYRELDAGLQSSEFLDYISAVTGIPDLLYDPDYIGGGTHENRDGQNLDAHIDFNYHPRSKTHRRLNVIVYLNPEWEAAWGGALELHSDPWNAEGNRRMEVLPLFNRTVIFETTETSWHGFEEIRLPDSMKHISRKSFAIYLYTQERPAEETAPSHATVYVPAGMPQGWNTGRVLDNDDVNLLGSRFKRMLGQMRFLYQREKRDSAQLVEARNAWRLPLQGYVKQPEPPAGIWADHWVSADFKLCFVPQRTMRGLEIELFAPSQLAADQVLTVELDGERWQHHVSAGRKSTLTLKAKRPAGARVMLSIRASSSFMPSQSGQSDDVRQLAWLLREALLMH